MLHRPLLGRGVSGSLRRATWNVSGTQISALDRDPDDADHRRSLSAVINFQQQQRFRLADDGAVWVDRGHQVEAVHVDPDGPAAHAGLKTGDTLLKINGA